jgi:lipopolysaccharide transport system permease protein
MSIQSSSLAKPGPASPLGKPTVVIEPTHGIPSPQFQKLWRYRELLYFLVWRDIKVRYKQSVLGILWIIIQPLVTMVVFTVLFNQILGVDSDSEIPYPIFTYVALLPWTYFASTLNRGSIALVQNRNLVSKIYFPRLIIPIANVLPGLVDLVIAFVILLGMMVYYNIIPTAQIFLLPLALLLAVITVLGVILWLSALNVQYRDVQYIAPFLVQIWMYATPIIYPISRIPEQWRWLYNLNPMVSVVQSFRWVLLGDTSFSGISWVSVGLALAVLVSGVIYFRHTERVFADVV